MSDLIERALASARSARMLLDAGDYNSAISRAYYAMFDLARAELFRIHPTLLEAKTHVAIIRRFSKHFVEQRGRPRELGRALRRVFDARQDTEYSQVMATAEQAKSDGGGHGAVRGRPYRRQWRRRIEMMCT
jgi:uncharacterized protein (UPF0332 family)